MLKISPFKEIMQENKGKLFMLGYKSLNEVSFGRKWWTGSSAFEFLLRQKLIYNKSGNKS